MHISKPRCTTRCTNPKTDSSSHLSTHVHLSEQTRISIRLTTLRCTTPWPPNGLKARILKEIPIMGRENDMQKWKIQKGKAKTGSNAVWSDVTAWAVQIQRQQQTINVKNMKRRGNFVRGVGHLFCSLICFTLKIKSSTLLAFPKAVTSVQW